jgi:hypothetical protein
MDNTITIYLEDKKDEIMISITKTRIHTEILSPNGNKEDL